MTDRPAPIRLDQCLTQLVAARAAAQGGVVRRRTCAIGQIVGNERFLAKLDRRGFRAVENAGRTVVFCNRAPVRVLR
ncbi:hypothetical protein [Salipiger mucosus]|uniref:N-(5'-phosphoribosyl)anthranilate isomerase n=1 Tax=Salipiger mucosus DSM 16094 TaxID=1123237 RepID=S9Q9V7_9RHOB|nr:hypothetical protein [Salipiger mucosus]EPX78136.1 hypothetical protein Salmuc_04483 [Salipiger mucosus DSM 16094]